MVIYRMPLQPLLCTEVERSVMVIVTTVLARPLININIALQEAVQIIS